MPPGPRPSRRRLRRLVTAGLGLVAVAIVSGLTVFVLRAEPVERLIEVMTTYDEPDAAWALAEIEELDEEFYGPLCGHLESEETTSLHVLRWGYARKSRRRGSLHAGRERTWSVGEMARFVLATHLAIPTRRGLDAHDLRRAWNERTAEEGPGVARRLPWWLSGGFLLIPPGQIGSRRRIIATSDVRSMLRILTSRDRPEAIWAFEVMKSFPDEAYDRLVPRLGDQTATRVTTIAYSGGVASRDGGYTLGRLLRHLLRVRMGREDGIWQGEPPTATTIADLAASWSRWRDR